MKKSPLFILLLILSISSLAFAQEELTIEKTMSSEAYELYSLPQYNWLADGRAITYDRTVPLDQRAFKIYEPSTGKSETAFDMKKAVDNLKSLIGDKTPKTLSWPDGINEAGTEAYYIFDGDIFLLTFDDAQIKRITETAAEEKCVNFSPDGEKVSFVRDNNLYLFDLASQTETQLTFDGSETLLNGTLSWVYWEEVYGREDVAYWWSEDSKAIAFYQTDESPVKPVYFVDYKPAVPNVIKQRYPKVGDPNPIVKVGVVELNKSEIKWIDLSKNPYEYVLRVQWLPNNVQLSIQLMNREQTELDLLLADRFTGKVKKLAKETSKTWVNVSDDLYFYESGDKFIWGSERSGYAHLYLFDMEGNLINQITKGDWAIAASGGLAWVKGALVDVDEANDWIYFTALKESSVERHFYRIKSDGSNLEKLSEGRGTHRIAMSKDHKYYFDSYDNAEKIAKLYINSADGKESKVFASTDDSFINKYIIQPQELFTVPASDGFQLPAMIWKPKDFDPNKKYPMILYVYGGPSAPTVKDAWNRYTLLYNVFLNAGYIVASIDARSSSGISKDLEDIVYKQLSGPVELKDLVDGVKWFKAQSYVDPDRVGIWGWSGGGSFTINAMSNSKEFKAGIAVAAVSDWHYYDSKFAEAYVKWPEINKDGFEKTSHVKAAKNLHGRLMLVHGTYDDNVHPQNMWAFAEELIQANILFDMQIYPMRKHGIRDRAARIHLYNTMLDFWKKNL